MIDKALRGEVRVVSTDLVDQRPQLGCIGQQHVAPREIGTAIGKGQGNTQIDTDQRIAG